eukprot:1539214-Pleurochrysis_carterae.AAC.1
MCTSTRSSARAQRTAPCCRQRHAALIGSGPGLYITRRFVLDARWRVRSCSMPRLELLWKSTWGLVQGQERDVPFKARDETSGAEAAEGRVRERMVAGHETAGESGVAILMGRTKLLNEERAGRCGSRKVTRQEAKKNESIRWAGMYVEIWVAESHASRCGVIVCTRRAMLMRPRVDVAH